ncbi:MAG: hypothetical protein NTY98_05225 [Verrucomicrobia bacterium]|nr:hypothetical protein [Verrucomicrobiota bacterium]
MARKSDNQEIIQQDKQAQMTILKGWDTEDVLFRRLKSKLESQLKSRFAQEASVTTAIIEEALSFTRLQCFDSSPAKRNSLRSWRGDSSLESWLGAIAGNKVLELIGKEQSSQKDSIDDHQPDLAAKNDESGRSELPAKTHRLLADVIREQGLKKPRFVVVMQLKALGVLDVIAARLWAYEKDYVSKETVPLRLERLNKLGIQVEKGGGQFDQMCETLQSVLKNNPSLNCGRGPGISAPFGALTKDQKAELLGMARIALRQDAPARIARELWKNKTVVLELIGLLQKEAKRVKAGLGELSPGTRTAHHQQAFVKGAGRLSECLGEKEWHELLGRMLEMLLQKHFGDSTFEDEQLAEMVFAFESLMTAVRWQDRLWQDEQALSWLAQCLVPQKTAAKGKAVGVPSDPAVAGLNGRLQQAIQDAANLLKPMDFAPLIGSELARMHSVLVKAAGATGATLWLVHPGHRALQAVFNPGERDIEGRLQPLDEGIISWVYEHESGVFYWSESQGRSHPRNHVDHGVSGHPGNQVPHEHSKKIDRELGLSTQAMIAVPFQCCGANRGVLSMVRSGDQSQAFCADEREALEAFALMLSKSIEAALAARLTQ